MIISTTEFVLYLLGMNFLGMFLGGWIVHEDYKERGMLKT
jgi:hypothetical protein